MMRDQAAGLRRFAAMRSAPAIAIAGAPGAGKSTLVLNLCAALRERGCRARVLDAARHRENDGEAVWLAECRAPSEARELEAHLGRVHPLLIVTPRPQALVAGYGLFKALARSSAGEILLVIARVRCTRQAHTAQENFVQAARRFLGRAPVPLGWIPEDERIARAARTAASALQVFPDCAAAHHYRALADRVLAAIGRQTVQPRPVTGPQPGFAFGATRVPAVA
jgi:MinD-like ATPase involved in chromosome partitioning or flagellar assembly